MVDNSSYALQVSVIVVNYCTYALTCTCLDSVARHTNGVTYEIILVDNCSSEFEPVPFERRFPGIRVIRLAENVGFAKGNNAGLAVARGATVLLLNSDTELLEDSITRSFIYLTNNIQAGAASVRLISPDGSCQSVAQRFPSIRYQVAELLRLQKFLPRRMGARLLLGAFFDQSFTVKCDWIWGAYFHFKQPLAREMPLGRLDDRYFMYCEDMQWSWDIRKLGYEIHLIGDTQVLHVMGGSKGPRSALIKKNKDDFLQRNYGSLHRLIIKCLEWFLRWGKIS